MTAPSLEKPRVSFAFFHGRSLMSRMIEFFTRSRVSHVGFVLYGSSEPSKWTLIETWNHSGGVRTWWDYSSFEEHSPGTVVEVLSLEVTDEQFTAVREGFLALARKREPYNWLGVLDFVVKFLPERRPGKSFCSEGAWRVLAGALGIDVEASRVSPEEMRDLLLSMGAKSELTFTL